VRLNLGSGAQRLDGWTNVDVVDLPEVDIVHDLDVGPWPFEDASAEQIVAVDVFEHVMNPVLFMRESHRVLAVGGTLSIKTPHWRHQDSYTDPTHLRHCTEYSWDYWIPGTALFDRHNAAYGGVSFKRGSQSVRTGAIYVQLHKI
jgi:SAM-dependent methyltransferase